MQRDAKAPATDPNEPPLEFLYPEAFTVERTVKPQKVNELQKYELEIIKILLLYGNNEVDFEDYEIPDNYDAKKPENLKKIHITNVVSKEVYLNLQEDEIEFTNGTFKEIYFQIIEQLNLEENISVDMLVNSKNQEISTMVTNILMDDEKYVLSNWERKDVIIKSKESYLSKMVLDAIYNLRRVLIEEKINSLMSSSNVADEREQMLETIVNYSNLKKRLFERLHRVV